MIKVNFLKESSAQEAGIILQGLTALSFHKAGIEIKEMNRTGQADIVAKIRGSIALIEVKSSKQKRFFIPKNIEEEIRKSRKGYEDIYLIFISFDKESIDNVYCFNVSNIPNSLRKKKIFLHELTYRDSRIEAILKKHMPEAVMEITNVPQKEIFPFIKRKVLQF